MSYRRISNADKIDKVDIIPGTTFPATFIIDESIEKQIRLQQLASRTKLLLSYTLSQLTTFIHTNQKDVCIFQS